MYSIPYSVARASCPGRQHGAALIIGLIMLLVLSLLGVAAISNVSLQEKMAGSLMDRNRAFQSAETALRRAEDYIRERNDARSDVRTGDKALFDRNSDTESQPDPEDLSAWDSNYLSAPLLGDLEMAARYRIERQLKDSDAQPEIYRFSAIGFGHRPGTRVVLQATFVEPVF